jgi:hypothetical protein
MKIGPVQVRQDAGSVERMAWVEWATGDFELRARADQDVADDSDDASAFLCAALPLAMWRGEDLTVDGPVSAGLLEQCDEIQELYRSWDADMHPIRLSAHAGPGPAAAAPPVAAAFFSRGVDSLFTAARDRAGQRALGALVFGDGLEPLHDTVGRAEEIRLARLATDALDLPLVVVETNVRTLTDRHRTDWEDVLAGGLAFVAHSAAGRFDRLVIPSTDSHLSLDVCGSSPFLDPLYSTERLQIVHDTYRYSRLGKIRWLAEQAPELLAHIKVCTRENRPDNCGHCGKCVYTMLCLDVVGHLGIAALFPSTIDPIRVAAMRSPHLKSRLDLLEVADALEGRPDRAVIRDAIFESLRASALPARYVETRAGQWTDPQTVRNRRLGRILSLVLEGRPYPPRAGDGRPPTSARHLVRLGNRSASRVALVSPEDNGTAPGSEAGAALGGTVTIPVPGATSIWITGDGLLLTRGMVPPQRATRPVLGPWRRLPRTGSSSLPVLDGEPDGYLHGRAGEGRLPLYVAWRRSGPGQVVTTDRADPLLDSCGTPALVGYVDQPGATSQ